jgi:hypothetical protein
MIAVMRFLTLGALRGIRAPGMCFATFAGPSRQPSLDEQRSR